MILCSIGISTWVVWVLVGIVGGYMTGRLLGASSSFTVLNVLIGIIGSVVGGWLLIHYFGENDQGQTYSLVGAVVVCGLLLWAVNAMRPKNK